MKVGDRVVLGAHRATVRYIGRVQGQEGEWVGLEWDEPSRGRHSGVVDGVRYFDCAHEGAGSLIRAEKLGGSSHTGYSVLDALLARYSNQRGELGDVRDDELYVHTVRQMRVHIQVVGADKITSRQSQTQRLTSARLVAAGVSHVGEPGALAEAAVNLHELDLTANLIHSWDFACELLSTLPGLRILNLSDNKLALPTTLEASRSLPSLPNLQALVLNDCDITWQQVALLEPSLPNLEELHLAGNRIRSLQLPESLQGLGSSSSSSAQQNEQHEQQGQQQQQQQGVQGEGMQGEQQHEGGGAGQHAGRARAGFQRLKVLSLEDNQLSDWQEVSQLAHLPSLQTLNISNNPIPSIRCPSPPSPSSDQQQQQQQQQQQGYFSSLTTLYAASCNLASWSDVDELDKLPSLTELRLTGNPLLGQSKTGGRFEIIGRVGRLRMLNGSGVNARERTDAEIRYMQKALSDMDSLPGPDKAATLTKLHPRLPQLAQRHGAVLATASRANTSSNIASSMVEVTLTCVATSQGAKMGSNKKKLPSSTTLAALRTLCEKLCKVKAVNQKISIHSAETPFPEEISTSDERQTLGQLGVQDGTELFIDEYTEPQ